MTGRLDPAFDVEPPSGNVFLKYARTIRHLKLSQLAFQLRYRLWRAGTGLKRAGELRLRENVHHSPFARVVAPNVDETCIEFLNKCRNLDIESMNWVCADEAKLLFAIEKLTQKIIERKPLDGFEPVNDLPPSRLGQPGGSGGARRPKQPRSGHRDGQRSGDNARGHKPSGNRASGNRASGNR